MKIAIIGGSGFVGTSLINKLKEDNNYQVKNLDIAQSKKHHEITSITDIRDYCSLTKSRWLDATVLYCLPPNIETTYPPYPCITTRM